MALPLPNGAHVAARRVRWPALALTLGLAVAGCGSSGQSSDSSSGSSAARGDSATASPVIATGAQVDSKYGVQYEETGSGPMVDPTIPESPSLKTEFGRLRCSGGQAPSSTRSPAPKGCTRIFVLTASELKQKIANFPLKTAKVWGYNGSSPGPTLISFKGEPIEIVVMNELKVPTTLHPHGLHQNNENDGVAGISQPDVIMPGASHAYKVTPGHIGTFAYHSHFQGAVQEQRGLDGMIDVLPRKEHRSVKPDVDVNMTLQIWGWKKNGSLVKPFGVMGGKFPFDTINGKTGDASGGPIEIERGQRVRIRVYNASQQTHAMHLHGHDFTVVSKNGHAVPPIRETTQTVNPGDFYEIEFKADNPGNWIFHCHFPHHTANGMKSGFDGAPVGMTRIFHYKGYKTIEPKYFTAAGKGGA